MSWPEHRDRRRQARTWAAGILATGAVFATTAAARAAPPVAGLVPHPGLAPIDARPIPGADENITVIGRRRLSLAPLPGGNDVAAPPPTGFAPGSRLGPFVVTGGPTDNGVAAGLALPIKAVKGLEFGAQLGASRDAVAPAGSTAAMAATAGFRLHF